MIGEEVTDAQLNEMLALADLDKDGKINYEGNSTITGAHFRRSLNGAFSFFEF